MISRPLRHPTVVAMLFIFLIKPDSLGAFFSLASQIYNVLTCVVFAYLVLLVLASLRFSLMTLFVIIFQGYFLIVTYQAGGNVESAVFTFLRVVALCILIECGLQEDARALISGCALCFEIYIVINLFTIIAFPSGLYLSETTGNACYFLGHRNVIFKVLLPGLLATYLCDFMYKGKPGRRVTAFGVLILVTEVFVWSASALTVLGTMTLLYVLLFRNPSPQSHGVAISSCIGITGTLLLVVWRLQDLFSFLIVDILHKDLTLTTRTNVWDKALDVVARSPIFGYGLENHFTALMRFGTVESAHNFYLDQLYYGGIVALIIYFFGIWLVGRGFRHCDDQPIARGIAAVLSGFMTLGVVEPLGMGLAYTIIPFVIAYHADLICVNTTHPKSNNFKSTLHFSNFRNVSSHRPNINGAYYQ